MKDMGAPDCLSLTLPSPPQLGERVGERGLLGIETNVGRLMKTRELEASAFSNN
jgi:hypothetical protein